MRKLQEIFPTDTYTETDCHLNEPNPSTKLERRRRIEELAEKKRLEKELSDYEWDCSLQVVES